MRRGGYMPYNFDEGFPLKHKVRCPAPSWRAPSFPPDPHAPYYDYVFALQADGRALFGSRLPEVKLVAQRGKWKLYPLPRHRVDEPLAPPYPGDWAFDPGFRPRTPPHR